LELKQLRYFKHVAELGSFSKAATFISIAQPALSRQIRNLEIELDVPLLYRNGRGVTMTEAGALLLEQAKIILEQCEKTKNDVTSIGNVASGRVTLGLTPTISQVLIRPLIAKLRDEHPLISLEVVEGFSGHVNEWLAAGRLDIGLLNNAPRLKHLAAEDLLVEELFLVTPAIEQTDSIQTIPLKEIEKIQLILPSHPHGLRELVDYLFIKNSISINVAYEINALSAIKDLVEDGAGSTILPYAVVYREITEGRLTAYRIEGQPFTQAVVLATPTHRPLSRAGEKVLDCIKEEVRTLHFDNKWLGSYLKT
jgi:LysR family transcriptional regulator, nitrogen assimilation regulatory protein